MLRTVLLPLLLASPFTNSLHAMEEDDAGDLVQRGKPIQLLKGAGDTLEAVLGAGNNVLLKMSMDLNLPKIPLEKEQLEVPVRLFLTDFTSVPTAHPAVDLKVKVDWEATPLKCVLPDKPQAFDSYGQFTDWLNKGFFKNKIMVAYDFHIDVQKSAPSLTEHLFSLPAHGYLFRGTHAVENGSIKPDRYVPEVTYSSQRGRVNTTTATLKGTLYIKDEPYPIADHQQIFPHLVINKKDVKRDQTRKFYHHHWVAQTEITTLETYEEFPRDQLKDWVNAPSEGYSLLRQKPGDLKEISHIACSDGTTGDSVDTSDGKVFLLDVEGINEKDSSHIESIVTDKKGRPFVMRYLYAETPKEERLKSLEEEAENAAIVAEEKRARAKVEKAKAKKALIQEIAELKQKLEDKTTQHKAEVEQKIKDNFSLGEQYHEGQGVPQDYKKAMDYYLKAAKHNYAEAQYNIGLLHENGQGVDRDYEKALEWYKKAAAQNHADAHDKIDHLNNAATQYTIGKSYYDGRGVAQDYTKAREWLQKAAAQNYADAQNLIGGLYYDGRDVPQNYGKAMEWYLKAAQQNNANAQVSIGGLYYNGQGVEQDYGKAMEWWQKAAQQNDARAQFKIGALYYGGQGVEQNYEKAMEWYLKAAEQNNAVAQANIGWLYNNGKGVPQEYGKAMEWYLKAAEQNNAWAQNNVGCFYNNGQGMKQDHGKAMEWYQKAAEQNNSDAQSNIGWLYQMGQGVAQDYGKAMEWYLKSAEQNNSTAQYRIALLYNCGTGVAKDYEKAKEWYQKAAALGNEIARDALKKLK